MRVRVRGLLAAWGVRKRQRCVRARVRACKCHACLIDASALCMLCVMAALRHMVMPVVLTLHLLCVGCGMAHCQRGSAKTVFVVLSVDVVSCTLSAGTRQLAPPGCRGSAGSSSRSRSAPIYTRHAHSVPVPLRPLPLRPLPLRPLPLSQSCPLAAALVLSALDHRGASARQQHTRIAHACANIEATHHSHACARADHMHARAHAHHRHLHLSQPPASSRDSRPGALAQRIAAHWRSRHAARGMAFAPCRTWRRALKCA